MTRYFFYPLLLLFIASCNEEKTELIPNHSLLERLLAAEEIRYYQPEKVDSILNSISGELKTEDSDPLWARYYYLKAHLEYEKGEYENIGSYIDSAVHNGLYNNTDYKPKVMLLEALTKEALRLYEEAWKLYNCCISNLQAESLNQNELLKIYLAQARISKRIQMDSRPYLEKAKELVDENKKELDLGLYYSNVAFFSKGSERLNYIKLSNEYYNEHNIVKNYIRTLDLLAFSYINNDNTDSALYYHSCAKNKFKEIDSNIIGDKDENKLYHLYIESKLLLKTKDYKNCLTAIDTALYLSDVQEQYLYIYRLLSLKSELLFYKGQYAKARVVEEKAYENYLEYDKKIARNQIKYINARNNILKIKQENEILHLKNRTEKQGKRLFFLYSLIISGVLIFLIFNLQKLKEKLHKSNESLYFKDISLLELEDLVHRIFAHLEAKALPAKTIISKITQELNKRQEMSSWDTFCERYSFKYPNGEKTIRNAYPDLKPRDLQFLMGCHYGLSNTKMAQVFGIKETSVRKHRQRVRERLQLNADDDLQDLISRLF